MLEIQNLSNLGISLSEIIKICDRKEDGYQEMRKNNKYQY